jgi:hypothetical protein
MKHVLLPVCLVLFSVASKAQTITTFDVPGGVNTQPMAISPSGQVTGVYGIPNTTTVRGFLRDSTGNIVTFDVAGMNTVPAAINALGQITGIYTSNAADVAPFHSFLRQPNGTMITFDAPDAWDTEATTINASGEIAGWMQSNSNDFHAFLRRADGTITTFDVNGAYAILTFGMNTQGQVTGYWTDAGASRGRGFLRGPDGQIANIDVPAALTTDTWPYAINDKGQVAGYYSFQCPSSNPGTCDTDPHSFLRQPDGSYTNIDVPKMTYSVAVALDSKGQAAGYTYEAANQQMRGFLRKTDGSFLTFEAPGSNWTVPAAMSSAGEITGVYYDATGSGHGFVLQDADGSQAGNSALHRPLPIIERGLGGRQ